MRFAGGLGVLRAPWWRAMVAAAVLAALAMAQSAGAQSAAAAPPQAHTQAASTPVAQSGDPAGDQAAYPALAEQPDPTSFVKRADTGLVLLGAPVRFAGVDLPWLGLRRGEDGALRRTTAYEVKDAFLTVAALGGTVVRAPGLAGTAGCTLCLEPEAGKFSKDGFAALDQALKSANDLGIRLILPLTGGNGDCAASGADPQSLCAYVRWRGRSDAAAFFTDGTVRNAFLAHVRAVVLHVNALTGVAYKNDPAILAWENCIGCGAGADPVQVGIWTETVGLAIRAVDHFHLYENGALAGRIRPGAPGAATAEEFAPPSVDLVGDAGPASADEGALRRALAAASGAVATAGRAYAIDTLAWSGRLWPSPDALERMLSQVARAHGVAVALIPGLQGHADDGGFIRPAQAGAGEALYFPAIDAPGESKADMGARALLLRHFAFDMADVQSLPALPLPATPEIIGVQHGKVTWRGGAGAATYSVERSPDPGQPFTWETLCDKCAGTEQSSWQDPSVPSGQAWYRVMPFNQNGHRSVPSAPVRGK